MDDYFEAFRLNIKYYRDKKSMTQADLAVQANCSNGLIGNIEAGKVHPSFETIVSIATGLGVHPSDLFLRDSSASKQEIKLYIKNTLHRELDRLLDSGFPV